MKVACDICGRKFKGEHGVKIHKNRRHAVESISGAAGYRGRVPKKEEKEVDMSKDSQEWTLSGALERLSADVESVQEAIQGTLNSMTETVNRIRQRLGL